MRSFFKSGRYLFWIAALMMIGGGAGLAGSFNSSDDAAIGAGIFIAGALIWIRARVKEMKFEKENTLL